MPDTSERLSFLNLEIQKEKLGGTIDHIEFACFHKEKDKYKHYFHLERGSQSNLNNISYQQNCIADLCYLNFRNFSAFSDSYDIRTRSTINLLEKHRKGIIGIDEQLKVLLDLEKQKASKSLLKRLEEKVDAIIASQQQSYLNKIPTKADLENFLLRIDQESKKIEQETVQLAKDLTEKVKTLEHSIDKLENLIKKLDFKIDSILG